VTRIPSPRPRGPSRRSSMTWLGLPAASLCVLVWAACTQPEPVRPERPLTVSASLSTNEVRIGDIVELELKILHPADAALELPALEREAEIRVRNREVETRALDEAWARTTARYRLSSFAVGAHRLSTGVVQAVKRDGSVLTEPFPDIELRVLSLLAEGQSSLREIKDLVAWPRAIPRWVVALIAVGLLALVAAFLAARYLKRPHAKALEPPPPPAHEVALRALRALRARGWMEEGHVEPFFVELSRIVRHYLEDRFALHAPEQTTEEFIREAAESAALNQEHRALTAAFLTECDLVKFARHRPGRAEMESALDAAERLVKETRVAPREAA